MILGALCITWLMVFVRPEKDVPNDRIVVSLWQVTGAEDMEAVVPKWFNESQDRIYVKATGLPFSRLNRNF